MACANATAPDRSGVISGAGAIEKAVSQSLELSSAWALLFHSCMKALTEYTRLFAVYMSFVVFLAVEAAVIFLVYSHLGII